MGQVGLRNRAGGSSATPASVMPVYRPLGLDVWMEAPADGAHEIVLTVNGDEAEAGARLGFTTTASRRQVHQRRVQAGSGGRSGSEGRDGGADLPPGQRRRRPQLRRHHRRLAYCWGVGASGELGTGTDAGLPVCGGLPCSPRPVAVVGGLRFRTRPARSNPESTKV
jgi:hypothetical protein